MIFALNIRILDMIDKNDAIINNNNKLIAVYNNNNTSRSTANSVTCDNTVISSCN